MLGDFVLLALLLSLPALPPTDGDLRFSIGATAGACAFPPSVGGRVGVLGAARWNDLVLRSGLSLSADAGFARPGGGQIVLSTADVGAGWAWDLTEHLELVAGGGVEAGLALLSGDDGGSTFVPVPLIGAVGLATANFDIVSGWAVGLEARLLVGTYLVAPSLSVTTSISF